MSIASWSPETEGSTWIPGSAIILRLKYIKRGMPLTRRRLSLRPAVSATFLKCSRDSDDLVLSTFEATFPMSKTTHWTTCLILRSAQLGDRHDRVVLTQLV